MAVSYRQILLERDGQPLNASQVKLLLRQILRQLQAYHDRQQAHGEVGLSTFHQVPNGCHLAPPTRTPTTGTPQQDLVALARAAITLLTGYPPSPNWHWQEHCQIDSALVTVLESMLAGAFAQAGQVLAAVVPQDFDPTEVAPTGEPPPTVAMAVLPTPPTPTPVPRVVPPAPSPVTPQPVTPSPVMLLLLLGVGGALAVGGGFVWLVFRPHSPSVVTAPVPRETPIASPQAQVGGGGGQKVTAAPASDFTGEEGVALVQSWLDAKKTVFAPPYDLDVAANFLTGPAWTAVAKRDGSVDWLRQNNTYYRYGGNQVTLKRVVKLAAKQAILDIYIQEQLSVYKDGHLRQSKTDRDTYRFDLRRVGDTWKIYDRRSVN